MNRRYGIMIICAVILVLSFVATASARTWYVDDDFREFPYADFSKIQDAVNIASPGDTVIVYTGSYYENVNVDKRLNLTGIGMPIVNASGKGSVITLRAAKSIVAGFKVTGSGEKYGYNPDAGVQLFSDGNLVKNNTITNNNYFGIFSRRYSKNNTIIQNDINNCAIGIGLWSVSEIKLISNYVSTTCWGIHLRDSDNNSLSNNIISNTSFSCIELDDSNENIIANNSIYNTKYFGPCPAEGILLSGSNNSVINNEFFGIIVGGYENCGLSFGGSNNIIANNTIANYCHGIRVTGDYNQIYHNNFINNTEQALDYNGINVWDNGYPSGGNYWNDYSGEDKYSGPFQDQPGSDGIGDTLYCIDINLPNVPRDKYPYMNQLHK